MNRVMLIDDDLITYLIHSIPGQPGIPGPFGTVPRRLAQERINCLAGFKMGPVMRQELQFITLELKNMADKHELTPETLQSIQDEAIRPKGIKWVCYCRSPCREGEHLDNIVECAHRDCRCVYFHSSCIEKLGYEKVSRWYCTVCAVEMSALAKDTLRGVEYADENDRSLETFRRALNSATQEKEKVGQLGGGGQESAMARLAQLCRM